MTTDIATDLTPTPPGCTYIILVNWNGWADTLECLESIFRLTYTNYKVIVCDNASTDGSLGRIISWADGSIPANIRNPNMARFTQPPVIKPLSYTLTDGHTYGLSLLPNAQLCLVPTGSNLGFAGANNIGIRLALAQADAAYLWLLNNDTVVAPSALSYLIRSMEDKPRAGLCGSTLLLYDDPDHVQASGGSRYNPWTSRGGHLAAGRLASDLPDTKWVEQKLRYIVGASLLASRQFAETVGPMNENYFLYFEELDWAVRGRGRFTLAYAPLSVVYHKVGAAIGSGARSLYQSERADYWGTRNRIAFTWAHFRYALPSVYCFVISSALLRLFHRRFKNCIAVLAGAFRPTIPARWDIEGRTAERRR